VVGDVPAQYLVPLGLPGQLEVLLGQLPGRLDRLRAAGELVWNDLESLTRGPYLRTIPGIHPCDGFFAAILEKPGSALV